METGQPRTVVTILGTNYSGSHFLSLLLGAHSQAMHIGEVKHLRRTHRTDRSSLDCHLCEDAANCPVLKGINPQTIDRVYDLIFANLGDSPVSTLIDTSKKITWAKRFLRCDSMRMKYIHLIRDPRALARRMMLTADTPRKRLHIRWKTARRRPRSFFRILLGSQYTVYRYKWLCENEEISGFLNAHNLDYAVVTYQDLARSTAQELRRLDSFLDLDYEPDQLEYWRFQHHGTQKPTYEWIKQQKTRYFDTRWKTFVPATVQQAICEDPVVKRYLERQNLAFDADGLRRVE